MAVGVAQRREAGWIQGISLLLPITMSVMGALFVAPMIPKMMADPGLTAGLSPATAGALIGTVVTLPSLCVAIFSAWGGSLGDRFGRRRLLIWSMLLYSAFGVMPFFLDNLYAIIATRFVVGLFEALLMVLTTTMIGDYFEGARRDSWLAGQTGVASIAAVVVLVVAGVVGQRDWHNVFLLYLLPLAYLLLVLAFTWEPANPQPINQAPKARWADLPWGILSAICALTLFGSVMFYVVQIQLSSALTELGVVLADGSPDSARAGSLTAIASIATPIGTVAFIMLSRRLSLAAMFLIEFVLLGVGFIMMSHTGVPGFVAAAALNQIGGGMVLPTMLTWAMRQLPFEIRGRGTGVWQATFALGQFVSTVIVMPALITLAHSIWNTTPVIAGGTPPIVPAFQLLGYAGLIAALVALVLLVRGRSRPAIPAETGPVSLH